MSALQLAEPIDATSDSRRVTRSRSRMHAAASTDASSSVPSTRSGVCGFSGLASVEVHLVMQCLEPSSLAHVASTCRLLRAEALHPSAGRFLATCPSVRQRFSDCVSLAPMIVPTTHQLQVWGSPAYRRPGYLSAYMMEQALHSPLGRAHLPVTVLASPTLDRHGPSPELEPPHSVFVVRLMDKAAGWRQVRALDVGQAEWWSVRDALMLLSSPALQRVSSVSSVDGVWLSESVLSALCRLPLLTALRIQRGYRSNHPSFRLHPSALRHATALRSLSVDRCDLPVMLIAGLACPLPQLTRLSLSSECHGEGARPHPGLFAWLTLNCRPMLSRLRQLRLPNLSLSKVPGNELRGFLRALSSLRFLSTDHWYPNCILRALTDVGPESLPELRCVRFWQDQSGSSGGDGYLTPAVVRRFLQRFPSVRYCLTICGDGDEIIYTREQFAKWDRVCTASDHGKPNDEGVCAECTDDDDRGAYDPTVLGVPDADADADGDQGDDDPDGPLNDAGLETEPLSLEQTERAYAIALQAAAPWIEPPIVRYIPPPIAPPSLLSIALDSVWSVLWFAWTPARLVFARCRR